MRTLKVIVPSYWAKNEEMTEHLLNSLWPGSAGHFFVVNACGLA